MARKDGKISSVDGMVPLTPGRERRVTRDDLAGAMQAAVKAAEAATVAADVALTALEQSDMGAGAEKTVEDPEVHPAGHGTGQSHQGNVPHAGPAAFEQFMAALQPYLKKAGQKVRVIENAEWIKIEGQQNHRIYIAKTTTQVSRIESTLPPGLLAGASKPDRHNGRIASYLPADAEVVGRGIQLLAEIDQPLRGPVRSPR